MARSPTLKVKGDKALIRKLKRLGDRKRLRKVLRRATNASATIVARSVRRIWKAEASDTGFSAKSVEKKILRTKGGFTAIIGIDADAAKKIAGAAGVTASSDKWHVPANIDHLIEFGFQRADGTTVPAVAPLRRGFDASSAEAERRFAEKAAEEIEKEAMRG